MVVFQGYRLNPVIREDIHIRRGDAEQEFISLLVGGHIGGVRERSLKIDDGQVVACQDIADPGHGKIDIPVVRIQFGGENILIGSP